MAVLTYNANHAGHHKAGHPERPERLARILERLRGDEVWAQVERIEAPRADLQHARLVHTPAYVDRIEAAVAHGGAQLDPDTYTTARSLDVALEALGGVLEATRAVMEGRTPRAFAAVRPPGHHATPDEPMGFCLFSNVALAARWAQAQFGVGRVLIVDFDVHHGNGTQDVFYEDPSVLFMSTHQHPLYPGTGAAREQGAGAGQGTTVNVPLPARTGDAAYLEVFRRIFEPLGRRFRPELILVSAGYDAHWQDPLAGMHLSTAGFAALVRELLGWADAWCDGRLVAVLEGGYHADALAASVLATVRLLQDPAAAVEDPIGAAPGPDADVQEYIGALAALHGAS